MMEFSPINSYIPRASGTIDRPRLLQKLSGALDHKLTLISAPPGYGKTTIAAQFARQTNVPVAWHTVEENERDLPNLFARFLATLEPVAPGIQALVPTIGHTPGELAGLIANYLKNVLTRDIVIVLDDVHHLAGSPSAETWLRALATLVPNNCHLIIVSRILPDLPLAEMIARREVLALGQQELRLTPDEVNDLAREVLGYVPAESDIQPIASRLEGWPAGIILALQPLPAELEPAMLSGGSGPEALFDALASSMLKAQPPGLRNFLLASSTLTRMTPELCIVALDLPDAAYWLEEAQNRSLFMTRVAGGLVYHALFRGFLQRQLKATNPYQFIELHAKAAEWFEDNNRIDEAFEHYLSAELITDAAVIAERVAQSYFTQGKTETLLNWGARLQQLNADAPRLMYTCAMIHTDRYNYEAAEVDLSYAESVFAARDDQTSVISVQIQRAMINMQNGYSAEAATQTSQLIAQPNLPTNLRARALNILGLAQLRLGEPELATHNLEESVPLYRADGDAYAVSQALQDLVAAYTQLGRLEDAGACLQEVVALRRSLKTAGALALALNNLGFYYHLCSDYQQAMATFEEGLSVAARVPDRRSESYLLWSTGDLHRDQGAFDEAVRLYNKALELIGTSEPALRSQILISASILRRWQGQSVDAVGLAEEAYGLAKAHQMALERSVALAMVWAARAQLGDVVPAEEQLAIIDEDLRRQRAQFELLRVLAIRIELNLTIGNANFARELLQDALAVAHQAGSSQPLAAESVHSQHLQLFVASQVPKSSTLSVEFKRLRELQTVSVLRQHEAPGAVQPTTTYSLRVLTFGTEAIERDGKPVPSSVWRANAAREMFLYLLFVGPQTREEFSLLFWPDSSPKQVRSNFHTTLYRARQALGENVILFQDELYQINPEIDIHADAMELRNLTNQARLMPVRDARTEDLWRRAVEIYRGDFCPTLDVDWVFPLRETFRELYLDSLLGLAECARARGDIRQALSALRQALDMDPYREDIHRAVMTCYAERGEKRKVVVHFNELQQLLRRELAVEPSSETLALAQSLLH